MTSNLLCSKKDTEGIVRTNRMLNTEDSIEVLQQSFQTCSKLGDLTLQGTICRGPWQLRLFITCIQYATDIELHVHTYAVGEADITAREGSPHNVLHLSSYQLYLNSLCCYCTWLQSFSLTTSK